MCSELENNAKAFLEKAVKERTILIDTSSILNRNFESFWNNLEPILRREKKAINMAFRSWEEVHKFATNAEACRGKDPGLHERAKKAINRIDRWVKSGLIKIYKNDRDNFSDNVLLTVCQKYRMDYKLLLVTQDKDLAYDAYNINLGKSAKTLNTIQVSQITPYGYLGRILAKNSADSEAGSRVAGTAVFKAGTPKKADSREVPAEERFAVAAEITKVSGYSHISYIPKENDSVIAKWNGQEYKIKLVKEGPSGGEGTIYDTDILGYVAKIYKKEKIDLLKHEKLKLMLSKKINCEGVCFPAAILYNERNEFVGYLMKQAHGEKLKTSVFIPADQLKTKHPDWKRTDTVQLCITILKKIQYLHDRNIILGDINEWNILVESPTEVYFVDTDSYQIEGYPCPVGTDKFTAPEIQGKKCHEFLRTIGNERFAVATLLFMFMVPGKHPYALLGGENAAQNIINGEFAYPAGDKSTGKAPLGQWRYCWSHLPRYLKEDFYQTFKKGESHSTEGTRYSTADWLKKFEHYHELLKSGKLSQQDEMALDLFPTRFKKNINAAY